MQTLVRLCAVGLLAMSMGGLRLSHVGAHSRLAPVAPTCQADQLAIAPDAVSGATGHIALDLRLRNVSARSCTLKGYATVVLLDGSRRPLPTVLAWGSGGYFQPFNRPVRRITLAPHGAAFMAIGWSHIPGPGQSCPLAPNLLLLPPGASSALLVSMGHPSAHSYGPVDACAGRLAVSPVGSTPVI